MKDFLLHALIIAFASIVLVDLIAYWPTIKDLYYRKKPSANITSFFLWTVTSLIAFLYSLFILSDLLLRIVSGAELVACSSILFLSLRLKRKGGK
jgi:hypothetical protein